jgi:hypothetical protein
MFNNKYIIITININLICNNILYANENVFRYILLIYKISLLIIQLYYFLFNIIKYKYNIIHYRYGLLIKS